MLSSPVWRDKSRLYFTIGLCLGGTTTALLAVTMGSLVRGVLPAPVVPAAVAALAAFVLAGELGLHRISLPHRPDQVPSAVIGEGSDLGALRFGYEMGTGMRTHMPSNVPYLALAAALLMASWPQALAIGLGFGLGRAWMALGRHYGGDPSRWDGQWQRHATHIRQALAVAMLFILTALLAG